MKSWRREGVRRQPVLDQGGVLTRGNYRQALTVFPFALYIRNTLIIAGIALISATLSSSMAAYAFARLDWPGRDLLFIFVLSTLMIPGVVTLVPQFILWNRLGFVEGEQISIVSRISGNLIVNVKDTRVALDRSLANRIVV